MARKTIAVVGATGAQGGGLVRAILADTGGEFAARALTRDVNGAKAKELAKLGAEVVAANVDDAESLRGAFQGAHGAFCVTFFWDHFSPEKELAEARAMAQAAKDAGLKHVIWSTLEDTRKWVPLDRRPHAHPPGQVQGAALRRQGRGERDLHRARSAHDLPQHVLLLGQPDPLRHGAEEGSRRQAGLRPAHGRQEAARDRRRGHRPVRLRHLQAPGPHRQDRGHRRRAPDRRADGGRAHARRWGRRCCTTR